MHDEATDLMKTLVHTVGIIASSTKADRRRIADAYAEAQAVAARIELEDGSVRPRVVACLQRFKACEAAEDVAAAAWMLTAVQERIDEHNLAGWQALKIVADKAAALLRPPRKQMH